MVNYIIKHIKKLDKNKKLIVTIDGTTGCGKTSIAKRIAHLTSDVTVLSADYFIYPYTKIIKNVEKFKKKPNNLYDKNWYDNDEIKDVVNAFLSNKKTYNYIPRRYEGDKKKKIKINLNKRILIVEGCFISHDRLLGKISDSKIFLSIDEKISKKRDLKRRLVIGLKRKSSELSSHFHSSYKYYVNEYKIPSKSDLHIKMDSV